MVPCSLIGKVSWFPVPETGIYVFLKHKNTPEIRLRGIGLEMSVWQYPSGREQTQIRLTYYHNQFLGWKFSGTCEEMYSSNVPFFFIFLKLSRSGMRWYDSLFFS